MDDEKLTLSHNVKTLSLTTNALKYIAIIAMVIDHTAVAFVPNHSVIFVIMRFFGRIAAPVMFFAAVEGYHHTRNVNKYMARLLIFAVISYIPFIYFESGGLLTNLSFSTLNVIYTIFLGIACIRVYRELKNPVIKTILILGLTLLSVPADWSITGILMIFVFEYFYGDYRKQVFGYVLIIFSMVLPSP
jgi:hypothetical protein